MYKGGQFFLCVFLFILKDTGVCSMFQFEKNFLREPVTVIRERPSSDFQKETRITPTISVIIQDEKDSRVEAIIRWISEEGLSIISNFENFPNTITSKINSELQDAERPTRKSGFDFIVFSDVDGLNGILKKAHQLDRYLAAGSLLRHFSTWLIVLTSGVVDSLMFDDVLFDNVAVTTLQAMGMTSTVEKVPSLLYTLMWKKNYRQLQNVSQSPNERMITRVFPNTKHGLNGRVLKAAVLNWETCEKRFVGETFTFSGFCDFMLSHLSRTMNFSYEYIEPRDQSWGVQYNNDTWDGIIQMLIDGTADICPVLYSLNYQMSQYVTFLHPFANISARIIYKKPEAGVNWTVMLDCFKWQIYMYGFVVFLWVSALFIIFKKLSIRTTAEMHHNSIRMFVGTIWTTIGVPFKQGSPTFPAKDSQRILLCFWWLFCIVITSVYCGNLVARLSVVKEDIPFTGLDDLLDSGYDVGVSSGGVQEAILKNSNKPLYKRIWQKIREHQPRNMTPKDDGNYHSNRLIQGGYALISTGNRIRRYTANNCDIAATHNVFFKRFASFLLPKHSALAELFNTEIMSLEDRGLPDYWKDLATPKHQQCSPLKQTIFKVENLFMILVVSGIGITIATFVLLLEKYGVKSKKDINLE